MTNWFSLRFDGPTEVYLLYLAMLRPSLVISSLDDIWFKCKSCSNCVFSVCFIVCHAVKELVRHVCSAALLMPCYGLLWSLESHHGSGSDKRSFLCFKLLFAGIWSKANFNCNGNTFGCLDVALDCNCLHNAWFRDLFFIICTTFISVLICCFLTYDLFAVGVSPLICVAWFSVGQTCESILCEWMMSAVYYCQPLEKDYTAVN